MTFFSRIANTSKIVNANSVNDHYNAQLDKKAEVHAPLQRDNYTAITLKKGQKVMLRSGRMVTVDGESENYFWVYREGLPYSKAEVLK